MSTFNSPTDILPRSLAKSSSVNALDAATATAFGLLPDETLLAENKVTFGVDTGAVNAYEVAMPTTITGYTDSLEVRMRALNTNTSTTATLNVDAVGAVEIRRPDDSVLALGDITAGSTSILIYSTATSHFHVFPNSSVDAGTAAASAAAAAVSAAAALVSENNSSSSESAASSAKTDAETAQTAAELAETNVAADLLLTNADVVTTNADVVLTNADVLTTNADVVLTNADVVTTAQDVIDSTAAKDAAELAQTGAETAETNSETAETNSAASAAAALVSENKAEDWAIEVEDTPVEVGKYSALHWAAKSATSAASAMQDLVDDTTPTLGGALDCNDLEVGKAYFKDTAETTQALGSLSSATAISLASGNVATCTIAGALTFSFTNPPATGRTGFLILEITNGGAYTITWPGSIEWDTGSAPGFQVSGVDILTLITRDAGTTWRGIHSWKEA